MTASGRGGRFRGAPAALRPRGNPLIRLEIPAPAQRLDTSRSAPVRPAGPSDLAAPRQPDAGEQSAAPVSGIGTAAGGRRGTKVTDPARRQSPCGTASAPAWHRPSP
jgi:hypothetical protein